MNLVVHLLRNMTILSSPVIPHIAKELATALGAPKADEWDSIGVESCSWSDLAGHRVPAESAQLVRKIEPEAVHDLRLRFAGGDR